MGFLDSVGVEGDILGGGVSPAERFTQAGVYFSKADDERVKGWQDMYSRVKDKMFLAFDTCYHFIRTVPTLECDENKPEDVKKKGEDHPGDGARYACMARPYRKKKPKEEKPWYERAIIPPTFNELMEDAQRSPTHGSEII